MNDMRMPGYALIVAGGTGTRMGAGKPKQLIELQGKPIMVHTLQRFLNWHPLLECMVVLHPDLLAIWPALMAAHLDEQTRNRIMTCEGGSTRTASVNNGLEALYQKEISKGQESRKAIPVAIHDAVRPFVRAEMLEKGFSLAEHEGSAVAGVPVKSSIRELTEEGSKAVDRSRFFHVQTPQIFRLEEILSCYRKRPHDNFTDDAGLAEWAGMEVRLYEGTYNNIKITTPEDLSLAELLLQRGE